jgi:hypothetical protein
MYGESMRGELQSNAVKGENAVEDAAWKRRGFTAIRNCASFDHRHSYPIVSSKSTESLRARYTTIKRPDRITCCVISSIVDYDQGAYLS